MLLQPPPFSPTLDGLKQYFKISFSDGKTLFRRSMCIILIEINFNMCYERKHIFIQNKFIVVTLFAPKLRKNDIMQTFWAVHSDLHMAAYINIISHILLSVVFSCVVIF